MMGWDTAFYLLIASIVISYALAPKPNVPVPPAFQDIDFPQADEGTPQAVLFGDCFSGDWCVLWVGNYRTSEVKSSGGKK